MFNGGEQRRYSKYYDVFLVSLSHKATERETLRSLAFRRSAPFGTATRSRF